MGCCALHAGWWLARPLSPQHCKLRSNTITTPLHISDGLDDYLLNVIIVLYVRKTGRGWGTRVCIHEFCGGKKSHEKVNEVEEGGV